jgi:heme/copper-type cytochrome/quinol oxidase subunit 2
MTALEGMPSGAPVEKIQIKGDKCEWSPNIIKVKKDTHVFLEVESVDWNYNFRLNGYGLRFSVNKGEKAIAEFYASEKGEFEFGCYIEKGWHYSWGGMVGKLIVE